MCAKNQSMFCGCRCDKRQARCLGNALDGTSELRSGSQDLWLGVGADWKRDGKCSSCWNGEAMRENGLDGWDVLRNDQQPFVIHTGILGVVEELPKREVDCTQGEVQAAVLSRLILLIFALCLVHPHAYGHA